MSTAEQSKSTRLLDRILAPLTAEQFKADYWPRTHLVLDGHPARFQQILGLEGIDQLSDVLKLYNGVVAVVGEAVIEESGGITDRMAVPAADAIAWYQKGAALEFDFLDMYTPRVTAAIEQLRSELTLPRGTVAKAVAYAARDGGGFPAHFDAYFNFVFQIRGNKTWRILPNRNVVDPVEHYELAAAPYVPPELKQYWVGEHPDGGLAEAEQIVLKPGSVLFLPRGPWHATESREETLSINLTFGAPAWLDLVLAEIRTRLVHDGQWRGLAKDYDLCAAETRAELRNQMTGMLSRIASELHELSAEDVLARHAQDFDPYERARRVVRQLLSFN